MLELELELELEVESKNIIKDMIMSSSFQPTTSTSSHPNSNFNENRWVIQIRRTLEEELEEENNEIPVSIFSVPKTLIASNHPESYTPQQVALGPYHHWRPELYEMERYKLSAARRILKRLSSKFDTFQAIVDQLIKLEPRIRACYHKYLDFSGETLAWMMAVDAAFLLEFLEIYSVKEGKLLTKVTSRMSHLVDSAGRKSAHIAILRDMLMLENQVPLFLLRKMLELELGSKDSADEMLLSMLTGLCRELYPFKSPEVLPNILIQDSAHILDFFYRLLMSKAARQSLINEADHEVEEEGHEDDGENDELEKSHEKSSRYVVTFLREVWKIISKLNKGPVRSLKSLAHSKPVKLVLKMPWTIVSKVPGLKLLKEPIEHLFLSSSQDKEQMKPENDNVVRPPLIEELTIPSVTMLAKAGVCFVPTNGGISSTHFDKKTFTLSLPKMNLDVNTGVILRNMVAYEACSASGPLVFTRFIDFINGIVDTREDAKLLRERGIIMNRLKSDEEVANLCNGMSKSIKLTKVPFLDKVVEDVNKYYNGRWKVKAEKCIRGYVFGSWKVLTLLACIMLLCLMALQAFCSVYSCSRMFKNLY